VEKTNIPLKVTKSLTSAKSLVANNHLAAPTEWFTLARLGDVEGASPFTNSVSLAKGISL
jgi:hypothetical protein